MNVKLQHMPIDLHDNQNFGSICSKHFNITVTTLIEQLLYRATSLTVIISTFIPYFPPLQGNRITSNDATCMG